MQYGQGQGHLGPADGSFSIFAAAAKGIKQIAHRKSSGLETMICQATFERKLPATGKPESDLE